MKKLLIAAALSLSGAAFPTAVSAQDATSAADVSPEALDAARGIVTAMFPLETREDTLVELAQSMGAQIANAGSLESIEDDGARAIIENGVAQGLIDLRPIMARHIPAMMEATAVSYADTFTLSELQAIREFAATPAGSAFFRQSVDIMNHPAVVAVNGPYFEELQAFARDMQAQMLTELEAYFMDQAETAADPA